MADDGDNLILHLLREMRGEMAEIRKDTGDLRARMIRIERQFDEFKESAVVALGWSAHAVQVVENRGERFDLIQAQLDALRRRVTELEARP